MIVNFYFHHKFIQLCLLSWNMWNSRHVCSRIDLSHFHSVWHFSNFPFILHTHSTLFFSPCRFVSLSADKLPLHVPTGLHCRLRHVTHLPHYRHSCVHSLQVRPAHTALHSHGQSARKMKSTVMIQNLHVYSSAEHFKSLLYRALWNIFLYIYKHIICKYRTY